MRRAGHGRQPGDRRLSRPRASEAGRHARLRRRARAGGFKERPEDIARGILDGIAAGEEEIYADQRARDAAQALRDDPKKVEAESEARWRRDWLGR